MLTLLAEGGGPGRGVLGTGCWDLYGHGWSNSENPELNARGGMSSTSSELPLGVEPDALINE